MGPYINATKYQEMGYEPTNGRSNINEIHIYINSDLRETHEKKIEKYKGMKLDLGDAG